LFGLVCWRQPPARPATVAPPVCLLSVRRNYVTLAEPHGRAGRTQEFVLAALVKLGAAVTGGKWVVLSGALTGETVPPTPPGAGLRLAHLELAKPLGLSPSDFL